MNSSLPEGCNRVPHLKGLELTLQESAVPTTVEPVCYGDGAAYRGKIYKQFQVNSKAHSCLLLACSFFQWKWGHQFTREQKQDWKIQFLQKIFWFSIYLAQCPLDSSFPLILKILPSEDSCSLNSRFL